MTAPAVEADPIDSMDLDLSSDTQPLEGSVPPNMVLGGERPADDDEPAADTLAVAETVAPKAAPAAKPADALPEGYTRDTLGRVHRKDGTLASKEEVASLATAPAQQPTTVPVKAEPFRYRHNGQDHEQAGFEVQADGSVVVKPDQVGLLRDAMNTRHVMASGRDINEGLRTSMRQLETRLADAAKIGDAKAAKYNNAAILMFDKMHDPAWQAQFSADPMRELAILKRELAVELKTADLAIPRQDTSAPAQGPSQEQLEEAATETYNAVFDEFVNATPALRTLYTSEELAELHATIGGRSSAYFVQQKGEWVLDTQQLKADFDREVAVKQRLHDALAKASQDADQKAKLAAQNARSTQTSIAAPPTAGGGTAPAKKTKGFESAKDVNDWWDSNEL